MSYSYPKSARLRLRREFQRVSSQGRNLSSTFLFAKVLKTTAGVRLGITVTRKYGKAHDRNRFKRCVRESFRLLRAKVGIALDINIRPQACARQASFQEIFHDLEGLLSPFILPLKST